MHTNTIKGSRSSQETLKPKRSYSRIYLYLSSTTMKKSCVLLGIVAISFAVAAVHGEKAKEALKGENSFANFCATFCGPNQPRTPPCIQKGCYSGGGSRHSNARSHHSNARSHRSNVRSHGSYDHTRLL